MKKLIIVLLIQVQILSLLLVYLLIKSEGESQVAIPASKVENIRRELKKGELSLIKPKSFDISLGDTSAVRMVFYSRPDCKYCDKFFKETYPELKKDIDSGNLNLIVRYLTHPSKPMSLFAVQSAYYAYRNGFFDEYLDFSGSVFPDLESNGFRSFIKSTGTDMDTFESFINNTSFRNEIVLHADIARSLGVNQTPTFYIEGEKIVGNKSYPFIARYLSLVR